MRTRTAPLSLARRCSSRQPPRVRGVVPRRGDVLERTSRVASQPATAGGPRGGPRPEEVAARADAAQPEVQRDGGSAGADGRVRPRPGKSRIGLLREVSARDRAVAPGNPADAVKTV